MAILLPVLAHEGPTLFAGVVVFVSFFLIARVAKARQPVALAFGFAPMMVLWLVEHGSSLSAATQLG